MVQDLDITMHALGFCFFTFKHRILKKTTHKLKRISKFWQLSLKICLGAKLLVLLRDGFGTFTINFPHQGAVTLIKALDYEKGEGFKKITLFS